MACIGGYIAATMFFTIASEPKPAYFCTRLAGETREGVRMCPTCPLREARGSVLSGQSAQKRGDLPSARRVEQK